MWSGCRFLRGGIWIRGSVVFFEGRGRGRGGVMLGFAF